MIQKNGTCFLHINPVSKIPQNEMVLFFFIILIGQIYLRKLYQAPWKRSPQRYVLTSFLVPFYAFQWSGKN